MSDRELRRETIDVVEVTIAVVFMLLLQLCVAKLLEIKASLRADGFRLIGIRTCGGRGGGLSTLGNHLGQLLCLAGSLCAGLCMGTHSLTSGERENPLALVNLINVRPVGEASVGPRALCNLRRAKGQGRTHDGAFSRSFGQPRNRRQSGRR